MKKMTTLFLALFITTIGAFAQQEQLKSGFGLSFDHGSAADAFGIGIRYQHHLLGDHLRIVPGFTYFFDDGDKQAWSLRTDLNYLINLGERKKLSVYPIIGLEMMSVEYKTGLNNGFSKNGYGVDFGGGVQYKLMKHFWAFGEVKYGVLSQKDQFAFLAGISYNF